MEQALLNTLIGTAALLGVAVHQLIFKRFEVDKHPVVVFVGFAIAPFALSRLLNSYLAPSAQLPTSMAFLLVGIFLATMGLSLITYRVFFHPLHNFPGPFAARLSKFWCLSQAAASGMRWHRVNVQLHEKYGDYVRTGPRELSISDPRAIPHILGFSSKAFKGPFYDSMEDSVNTTRDRVFHKQRRKVWDSSMKSLLQTYSPVLEGFTDIFLSRLNRQLGDPIEIKEIANHYSYDVMTQLAYGKAGGFLSGTAGKTVDAVIAGIKDGVDAIGLLYHVPWMLNLVVTFGSIGGPIKAWNDWSKHAVVERKKNGSKDVDLMKYLLEDTNDDAKGRELLFSESRLIMSAGRRVSYCETVSIALTEIFIVLAYKPEYVAKLRGELDPVFASDSFSCETAYPVLESIINEVLRLYPPVLFAAQRVTPSEGITIDSIFIPGDTVVSMPYYQLNRDPRNFVQPNEFIPERWTEKSDMVMNRSAFIPFVVGPGNCPGKALALMELRSVLARTIREYDVQIPPNVSFDWGFFDGVKDLFVAWVPTMNLIFTRRQSVRSQTLI
ncbi:hypothetical protein BP5796_04562 [Coleophoma crateriformis]|uniref:Benzoate 4-monooxygenase cytochrome P450 n=1 Tax=Coleophoma crateriformis TaxID=565419 RepID=A0A3D8SAB3_9HELO|nr:hypothetical protein BP5796_04562 [Coleophoma crateriformis]